MHGKLLTVKWCSTLQLFGAALAAGLAISATDAHAQSRICRQLEAQLTSLSSGGSGSSAQARRYDQAIQQQRTQIRRGEQQYRRAGCGGGFFSRDNGGAACDAIGRGLDRMERNLAQLERKRSGIGGGGDTRRERSRILAAIDANDCRNVRRDRAPEMAAREPQRGGNFFERLFGGGIKRVDPREDGEFQAYDGSARVRTTIGNGNSFEVMRGGGNYRTLCVRTCDGYYWPISYSSSSSDFQRDEQNCQTMCPGTEVKLYSHRVPDQESENMIDAQGSPYTDLATAFKYRDAGFTRPQGCTCTAAKKNFSVVAGEGAMGTPNDMETSSIALPSARPDPATDPETLANRGGSFDAEDMKRLSEAATGEFAIDAARKVRVVGPAYLPDPEGAIDLRAPARTAIQ